MQTPQIASKMRKRFDPKSITFSSCYGLLELQKRSLSLKAWQDFEFTMEDGNIDLECMDPQLMRWTGGHTDQTNGFAERHGLVIAKIDSPYFIECDEDIDFIMSASPFGHQCFCYVGGVTNYKYQHATNIFAYFKKSQNGRWLFNAGDNMVNITPMSDRPLKVNHHLDVDYHKFLGEKMRPLSATHSFLKRRKADREKNK